MPDTEPTDVGAADVADLIDRRLDTAASRVRAATGASAGAPPHFAARADRRRRHTRRLAVVAAVFVLIGGVAVAQSLGRSDPRADQVVTATTPDQAGTRPATRTSDDAEATVPESTPGTDGFAPAVGPTSTSAPASRPTGATGNAVPPTTAGSAATAPRRTPGGPSGSRLPSTTDPRRSTTPDGPPATAGSTTTPLPTVSVDQEYGGPRDEVALVVSGHDAGQSFVAGRSGDLTAVGLRLSTSTAATLVVTVERADANGFPDGTAVASGSLTVSDGFYALDAAQFTDITLAQPGRVEAGQRYTIRVHTADTQWRLGYTSSDGYPGGSAFYPDGDPYGPPGPPIYTPYDFQFRTWVRG